MKNLQIVKNKNLALNAALIINIVVVVAEIFATSVSFVNSGWSMLQFYTVDSNILAMLTSAVYVCMYRKNKSEVLYCLRFASTINLTLTFFIALFVLSPTMGGLGTMMLNGNMLFHHTICPILTFVSFVFWEKDLPQVRLMRLLAMIPTVIYAVVLVILNVIHVLEGPYPFLKVYEQPIWVSVIWTVLILGITAALSFVTDRIIWRLRKNATQTTNKGSNS